MGHKTALVVDDSKLARITLKKKLEQRQLEVVMVESGTAALAELDKQAFDLVFMDHLMPEMDGFETTQNIKANANTAHIPVVMCSGKDEPDFAEQAAAIGASGVLSKPPENSALDKLLGELSPNTDSVDSLLSGTAAKPSAPKPAAAEVAPAVEVAPAPAAVAQDDKLAQVVAELKAQMASLASQVEAAGAPSAPESDLEPQLTALKGQLEALAQEQQQQQAQQQEQYSSLSSQLAEQAPSGAEVDTEALEQSLKAAVTADLSAEQANLKQDLESSWSEKLATELAPLQALNAQLDELKQELAQQAEATTGQAGQDLGSAEAMVSEIQQALQPVIADMLDQRLATETGQLKQQVEDQVGLQLSYRLEQLKAEQIDGESLKAEFKQLLDERVDQLSGDLRQSLSQELQPSAGANSDVTRELKDLREESIQAVRQAAEQALHKLAPAAESDAGEAANISSSEIITELNQQLEQQKRDMEAKTSGLKFALFCSMALAIAGVAGHWFL